MESRKEKIIDRNYGSIPHLSISKLAQQADKKIEIGQEKILTEKVRDYKDLIIVTEKIDGSNVGVIKTRKGIIPITRSGYACEDSPYYQHHLFARWMMDNIILFHWLPLNWRIAGEWCIMAHGTKYDISCFSPFVAFDIINDENRRIPYIMFLNICYKHGVPIVPVLHIGQPVKIKIMSVLQGRGHYGDPEEGPEGFVYRCERDGHVDFLAKYVRADKEDGKYLDSAVYNKGAENHVSINRGGA